MILRDYQSNAFPLIAESIKRGNRRIVVYLATGGGKSLIQAEIIRRSQLKSKNAMFLVNRKGLVHQFRKTLDSMDIEHDLAQGENTYFTGSSVVNGTIQTISRRGWKSPDLIVIDEGHYVPGSKDYLNLIFANKDKIIVTFTATPFAKGMSKVHDELDGEPLFQDLIVLSTIRELIDQGFLVDCEIFAPSEPDLKGVRLKKNSFGEMDYLPADLEERVDKPDLIGDIVQNYIRNGNNEQAVVFAHNIAHSQHICQEFCKSGVKADHVDGYMEDKERNPIYERFKKKVTRVICNVAVLREGWDVPECSVMIDAAPTKSLTTYIQKAGRVLRIFPGKDKAKIFDHAGNCYRFGYPTDDLPLELCDGRKKEENKVVKKEKEKKDCKCPKCNFIKKSFVCGNCGHKPEQEHGVIVAEGELKAVQKKKPVDKSKLYSELKHVAESKGWLEKRLHGVFKGITGEWPSKSAHLIPATKPCVETLKLIQWNNIKNAKSKYHAR